MSANTTYYIEVYETTTRLEEVSGVTSDECIEECKRLGLQPTGTYFHWTEMRDKDE